MRKRTYTRRTTRATTPNPKRFPRGERRSQLRARLAGGREAPPRTCPTSHRLSDLLQESALECPICLQTLLWPVLGECGHLFCLPCADDLSRHDYACGMCRNFEPSYEPRVHQRFQELVRMFLEKGSCEERLIFEQRQKALQAKERERYAGQVAPGDFVDFWSIEDKCWRSVKVQEIMKDGRLSLIDLKGTKKIILDASSRRLAKHRHFTKEEPKQEEVVQVDPFDGRSSMFGVPMYINFFGNGDSTGPFNVDINELLGFVPLRPYPF